MTSLTPEQFAIVAREMETMLADGNRREAWRVMQMFADGRFNYRPSDFPAPLQAAIPAGRPARDYATLLKNIRSLAGDIFDVVPLGNAHSHELVKLVTRPPSSPYAHQAPICLVAGIHGDEADGVLASLEFARRFARSSDLIGTYALTIYPCVNPTGYEQMTRENINAKDLNREFSRDSAEVEVQIMELELKAQEFVGFIGGHSDYESFGIYAYATGDVLSERLAKPALFQASSVIPINTDPVIDGHAASYGIINETVPGALVPLTRGETKPFDVTIETPNLFALRKRVEAQTIAFETILQEYRAVASEGMYL